MLHQWQPQMVMREEGEGEGEEDGKGGGEEESHLMMGHQGT